MTPTSETIYGEFDMIKPLFTFALGLGIALTVACSPKTLSRRFQAELGSSPGRAYRHLRLTHAHQLLENTRLSISEIGLRTGYNNPAALSRAFKARFGRAPRQLRQ